MELKRAYQLRFDELNVLEQSIHEEEFLELPYEEARRKFEECLFWFFVDGYSSGVLEGDIPNGYEFIDIRYPDNETVMQKFDRYYKEKDKERMASLLESEAHRMWNTGSVENVATGGIDKTTGQPVKGIKPNKPATKTWITMGDEKVRDQHWMLEGEEIPFEEDFVTADGDYGFAPGMFQTAENNANCRCILMFSVK